MFPFPLKPAAAPEFLGVAAGEVGRRILLAMETPDIVDKSTVHY
jgi:hypothetical protein